MKKTKGIKVVLLDDIKSVILDDRSDDINYYKAAIALISLFESLSVELNNVTEAAVRSGEVYMTQKETEKEPQKELPKKEEQVKPKEKINDEIDEKDLVRVQLPTLTYIQDNVFKNPGKKFMLEILSETDNKVIPVKRNFHPVHIVGYEMYIANNNETREINLKEIGTYKRYSFSLYKYGTQWRLWEQREGGDKK